ncbi:hypothetical protein ACRJ4B_48125 [Streptomyces sp. GTA36]
MPCGCSEPGGPYGPSGPAWLRPAHARITVSLFPELVALATLAVHAVLAAVTVVPAVPTVTAVPTLAMFPVFAVLPVFAVVPRAVTAQAVTAPVVAQHVVVPPVVVRLVVSLSRHRWRRGTAEPHVGVTPVGIQPPGITTLEVPAVGGSSAELIATGVAAKRLIGLPRGRLTGLTTERQTVLTTGRRIGSTLTLTIGITPTRLGVFPPTFHAHAHPPTGLVPGVPCTTRALVLVVRTGPPSGPSAPFITLHPAHECSARKQQ